MITFPKIESFFSGRMLLIFLFPSTYHDIMDGLFFYEWNVQHNI